MVASRVWEAVPSFNARTAIGRVVVNPPERRGTVAAHPTKEKWHFCKCGRAFSNSGSYSKHRTTHEILENNIVFKTEPVPHAKHETSEDVITNKVRRKRLEAHTHHRITKTKMEQPVVKSPVKPTKHVPRPIAKGISRIRGIRLSPDREDNDKFRIIRALSRTPAMKFKIQRSKS